MTDTWWKRDPAVCWHPYTQHGIAPEPLPVVAASGAWLELADGRRILDGISSWWACLHGHGRTPLVEALAAQARTLDHVLFAGCTHEPAVRLAEELLDLTAPLARSGGPRLGKVFFSDNGSTAVEVALKAAYQSKVRTGEPGRTVFIALEGAYHGDTFGAMAAGEPDPFFKEFAPFLFEVVRVPPKAEALARAFEANAGQVAAFIAEPLVQGANCMAMHGADFLRAARELCTRHGAFFIADEVMTGFGRTGAVFACQKAGVAPDLLCLAKGLTGGMLPLSVTLVTDEIYDTFLSDERARAFFHGHTFTANPLGCAVALASMALLREEDTPTRLASIGTRIEAGLSGLRGQDGVKEIRRCGGIVAVELAAQDGGYLAGLGERLRAACREQEVLLRPLGNVLYALPPSCLTMDECDLVAGAIERVCRSVL